MNCQDVNEILDELRFDRLEPRQRQQVEAHVATCTDCARAWNAQTSLAALPDMTMPAGFQAQCRVAVAARLPAGETNGGRNHRRVLLWGSLTAMAAAAATLLLLSGPESHLAPAAAVHSLQAEATTAPVGDASTTQPDVAAMAARPDVATAAAVKMVTAPQFTVRVLLREPAPDDPKELNAIATDPVARQVLQALRTALVAELRKVPALTVVDEDPAQTGASSRHFRLRMGPLLMLGLDGRPARKENRHDISITVQEVQAGGATIDRRLPMAGVAVDPVASCTSPDAADSMPCDVPTTAIYLARYLRRNVFPADASETQPLQARFRDFSLAPEERFQAFVELFRLQAKARGSNLLSDADVVRAAVELSGLTDAAHRAQLWRAMRGVGDPVLVDPLLASMQQDPEAARIAAVETLAADFSGNPRARSALETAAATDASPLVRALARRGLGGEETWQAYMVSSLKDSTLPASQRVEALLHALYPPATIDGISEPSPSNYWQILEGLDDAAVRALAEVFPKAEQLRKWPGNNLASNFAGTHRQHPAVTEMLLTVLEHDTRALNRSVAGESLAQTHASQPRVRDALLKAVSSDPDASVRNNLRQVLERDYVKKAMEASAR